MSTTPSNRVLDDRRKSLLTQQRRHNLRRFAWISREALDASIGMISIGQEGETLYSSAREGPGRRPPPVTADPLAQLVLERGDTVVLTSNTAGGATPDLPRGFRSYIATPIQDQETGELYGVLALMDERLRNWDERDHQLLQRLAAATAADLSASGLAVELEHANARLQRVRADLEKERVQLREMIRMSPAFIASVEGPDAIFTMANDPFYELIGRRHLIGRSLREAMPEVVGQGVVELVERVYRTGQSLGADEVRIRIRKGEDGPLEERFVSFVYQPLIGAHWKITGVLVCGVDLTEQVLARKAAESAAADFRLMAETIQQVFWVADATGHELLYVSPAAEEVWGRSRDELLARKGWMDTVSDEDRARIDALYTPPRIQAGEYDAEYRIFRPDGGIRWIRDRAYPVRDEGGDIYRVVGIAEDVTERRALEMQLRQSQKMEAIGRLAGGIAHDFNNMLTAIGGHAQLLELELAPESPLRQHIEVIRMAADRSAALTRQLLAFSRKQILQPRSVDLNGVIRSIEPMLRRMIGEDIEVRTSLKPDLPPIFADPSQLEQVLMNLIVNARDAMPGGGKLTVNTGLATLSREYFNAKQIQMQPGRYAMLAVSDTGIGMDPLTEARIFEPFFTTKPPGKGTGLGLSTVYGIVKQTEGLVWVYSEPGHGTTFKVYLPLAGAAEAEEDVWEEPTASSAVDGALIMVVEDDESVRALVTRVLRQAGYRVLEAGDARSAAPVASEHRGRIDLLLTDVVLPTMSGRIVADIVRKDHPEAQVLFMSGYTDDAIVNHGVLDPGTDFIEKPFTPEQLLRRILKILRRTAES